MSIDVAGRESKRGDAAEDFLPRISNLPIRCCGQNAARQQLES